MSYTEIGLAFAAFNIVSAALQTPAGFLVDWLGARILLVLGLVIGAGAFVIAGLVNSYWVLVAMFALAGVGNTVYHPADYALLSHHVPPERIGALIGTLASGRISDLLVRRGFIEARVLIPAVCYVGAAALLIPGILASSLGGAIWFDVGGAALLSAANPPLDAARLDIIPARLWGRAESVRSFLRSISQAFAPLIFGAVTDLIAGFTPQQTVGTHHIKNTISKASEGTGLEVTFLIMLATLAAAGVFLARARHRYPVDVATAAAPQV